MNTTKLKLLLFPLYKNKDKEDCPIYCKISHKGTRAEINTGEKIFNPTENWNKAKQIVKGKKNEILLLNDRLEKIKSDIVLAYDKLVLSQSEFVAADIKRIYLTNEDVIPKSTIGILASFDLYIKFSNARRGQSGYSDSTILKSVNAKSFIAKFIKSFYKKDDYPAVQINKSFLNDLISFQPSDRKLKNSYLKMKIIALNLVCSYLYENDYIPSYTKLKPTKKLVSESATYKNVTVSSINAIKKLELKIHTTLMCRDFFLFQTLVGVAFADLMLIKYSNITGNYLKGRRKKTGKEFKVYIDNEAWDIINAYKDHPLRQGDLLFPTIRIGLYNQHLYKIASLSDCKLSAHVGRHTFGTLKLDEGYTIEAVSKMMGITITMAQKVYVEVTDNRLEMEREIIEARKKKQAE